MDFIWVFTGANARFPAAIFSSAEQARIWIHEAKLSGVLTRYPVDVGVYDWAIENQLFKVTDEKHMTPYFIERFTSAGMTHFHFENGDED